MKRTGRLLPKAQDIRKRIHALVVRLRGGNDPVANEAVRRRLSAYATAVLGRKVECVWDSYSGSDLESRIHLNPHNPRGASPADRKLVIDGDLEHELRGHWAYTPRRLFSEVCAFAAGESEDSLVAPWDDPDVRERLGAVRVLYNILEDGRIETRMQWASPEAFRAIVAADRVRQRWRRPVRYVAVEEAYDQQPDQPDGSEGSLCRMCRTRTARKGTLCPECFRQVYRWEQITGLLLYGVLPTQRAPVEAVEPVVRVAYTECLPWMIHALRGSSWHAFEAARRVFLILVKYQMVPLDPRTPYLVLSDAIGSPQASEQPMPGAQLRAALALIGQLEGPGSELDGGEEKISGVVPSRTNEDAPPSRTPQGSHADVQMQPASEGGEQRTEQKQRPGEGGTEAAESVRERTKRQRQLLTALKKAVSGRDWTIALDIETERRRAERDLETVDRELGREAMRRLLAAVNGLGAGPGIDVRVKRVPPDAETHKRLLQRNRMAGSRFAREIRELVTAVMRPQRFQRHGRIDRRLLVNALRRRRDPKIFRRHRPKMELDLALSILVDVSGSMSDFNRWPIPGMDYDAELSPSGGEWPPQLTEAVAVCEIGLRQLGIPFEIRAFGGEQWLVAAYGEPKGDGIGGLAGIDKGGTDMAPAIEYARIAFQAREEKLKVLAVMTDGMPYSEEDAARQLRLARQDGIHTVGVYFANPIAVEERPEALRVMERLFGPRGFAVIHTLDRFPAEVGRAIKDVIRWRAGLGARPS